MADYADRAYQTQPITEEPYEEQMARPPLTQRHSQYDNYAPCDDYEAAGESLQPPPQHGSASTSAQQPRGSSTRHGNAHATRADGREYGMSLRQRELIAQEQSGYGSDGSELSANSAQSMQKRAVRRGESRETTTAAAHLQDIPTYSPRQHFYESPVNQTYHTQRYGSSNEHHARHRGDELGYKLNGGDGDGRQLEEMQTRLNLNGDVSSGRGGTAAGASSVAMKDRKKSLMTRLLPGRNAIAGTCAQNSLCL